MEEGRMYGIQGNVCDLGGNLTMLCCSVEVISGQFGPNSDKQTTFCDMFPDLLNGIQFIYTYHTQLDVVCSRRMLISDSNKEK